MKSFFKLVEMTLALDFFGTVVILLLPFTFDWSWIRRPNLAIVSLSNKDGGGYQNATL